MDSLSDTTPMLLQGAERADPERAGGKAAALAQLAERFPVPPFLVIAPESISETGLTAPLRAALEEALSDLGPGPYAVRSSGRDEDGADAAHAGQFVSVLDVARERVAEAALRVWRSGFDEHVAAYRRARGLNATPAPPAVLVQQMIRARVAGVAFSVDPVSGARDCVVVSAVSGLADRLVGGEIDGDQYWIGPHGPLRAPTLVGEAAVLSDAEQRAVAELAQRAEAFFGSPQDIEWAIDEAGLHLLQSRPVTTIGPLSAPASSGPDDDALLIWDNANIVESYPGVVSPLTYSYARYIYAHVYTAFSKLMGVPQSVLARHRAVFDNMLGRIEGRIYYNLLNWYRVLALFPGFKANREFMEGMMGAEALAPELAERIAPRSASRAARFWDRLRLARVGLRLVWHQLRLKGTMARFYARLAEALALSDEAIKRLPASALAAEYRQLERKLLARWDAPLINDFLCMIAFGVSRRALDKWAGETGLELHAQWLIGQGDIVSAEPARLIREMGALAARAGVVEGLAAGDLSTLAGTDELSAAVDRYLQKFGDRCAQELKLESVTLHDDPAPLLRAIAAAARSDHRRSDAPQAPTLEKVFAGRPIRRWLAKQLMRWAGARVRDRENLRFERTRLFGRVRRIFLALGDRLVAAGRLDRRRDVFLLTLDEVLGAVEGVVTTDDLRALSALRETEMQCFEARPAPAHRIEVRGAHFSGLPAALARAVRDAPADMAGRGETRTGLACCRGTVTARVRVMRDPRIETLEPGEILVAEHTDPGWIAAFAAAAGVIAERGSLLSHSAIVAREMGVPCVVALAGVTHWLRTGDTVRLDGGTGTVERIARGEGDD